MVFLLFFLFFVISSISSVDICSADPVASCASTEFCAVYGEDDTACEECPPGRYMSQSLDPWWCQTCPAGTASQGGSVAICTVCQDGMYSDLDGSPECLQCPEGTFAASDALPHSECDLCPMGEYQDAVGMSDCMMCDVGEYMDEEGASECKLCPAGTYNNDLGQMECLECGLGEYQDAVGQTACISCPAGTYTKNLGNPECYDCSCGYFCDIGAISEYGAGGDTPCPEGYYCPLGEDKIECPMGYYCPEGSCEPVICPIGHYNDEEMRGEECETCGCGYFCAVEGAIGMRGQMVGDDMEYECMAGYVCLNGSIDAMGRRSYEGYGTTHPCENGYYCPAATCFPEDCGAGSFCVGGVREECPVGTFSSIDNADSCEACTDGFYCDAGSILANEYACEVGSFCVDGAQTPCPHGYHTAVTGAVECELDDLAFVGFIFAGITGFCLVFFIIFFVVAGCIWLGLKSKTKTSK